ncbi:MAG: hypothetical protein DME22_05010 [Verrucomicrobia bacterium]|nr:MAG: hypothetical protein DME22_05010 [Verrucomicrobiota bacterium]PYJ95922.1 MAG: hypothetical protein DME23_22320 [Verrucomicrobiota bacterium]
MLVVILIGVPAITSARFGSLRLSSAPKVQLLTLWGLGLAVACNSSAALWLMKDRKDRTLFWKWTFVFGALLAIEYAYYNGWLNFNWLKQTLHWAQNRF